MDEIIEQTNEYRRENELDEMEDANDLFVGDTLIIPVFIVTPVPTNTPTLTPSPTPEE